MVTIKEIDRLTRVSTATVSNVLNGKAGAAGETKAREINELANKGSVPFFSRRVRKGTQSSPSATGSLKALLLPKLSKQQKQEANRKLANHHKLSASLAKLCAFA